MTVLMRVNGSASIGMGHLARCVSLADGLAEEGLASVFLIEEDAAASRFMSLTGRVFQTVPANVGEREDALATVAAARGHGVSAVVTDMFDGDALRDATGYHQFHRLLRATLDRPVLAISGGTATEVDADAVVSPYYHSGTLEARRCSRRLLGPRYFILSREVRQAIGKRRDHPERADRILLSIGGSDPAALSLLALAALALQTDVPTDVRVVVGPGFSTDLRRQIADLIRELPCAEIISEPSSIGTFLEWTELAITGDGLTKYETAATGTPSIFLGRPDSPVDLDIDFATAGTAWFVPHAEAAAPERLSRIILGLRNDRTARSEMARRGRSLVDGDGVVRIAEVIQELVDACAK